MANLFNATIFKFRNFFGSGRPERNGSPSSENQSADKLRQLSLNQQAAIPKDELLGYDSESYIPEDCSVEDADSPVLEDDSAEYDDYSVSTMLPSYVETAAAIENAVGHDVSHSGCYCDYYSLRLPNRNLLDQPDASYGINEDLYLSAELLSPLTLTPIHGNMCYHLSFNHLNSIRRRCLPGVTQALIPELCCHDRIVSQSNRYYDWISEIYFDKSTFLQRQQMRCCFNLYKYKSSCKSEYFIGCPHQSLTVSASKVMYDGDMYEVQILVTNDPPQCESHPRKMWRSSEGPFTQMVVCTICHSDAECTLEIEEDKYLTIRYTCYRDLGSGVYSREPKWLALLTGQGYPQRQEGDLSLYARVWKAALDLKRDRLYEVAHRTPNGLFNMGTEKFRNQIS
ncbi:uncharacterized protein TrAFT101_006647 [Trichoderma asperellum]|uniref:uncharacterized protein n=1 Tax=Trichoderma asperellum TaxID=101201 RepID=UPI003322B518|nr:hypothetical protein TrAFT101_006647 [Trichoderma asperellum]